MKSLVLVLAGSCGLAMVNLVHAQGAQTVLDENIKVVHYEQMNYPPLARTALAHGVVVISVPPRCRWCRSWRRSTFRQCAAYKGMYFKCKEMAL